MKHKCAKEDFDFERNLIHVPNSKFGKTRTIPFIDPNFRADMRQFTRTLKCGEPVFDVKRRMIQIIVQRASGIAPAGAPVCRRARRRTPLMKLM